METIAFGLNLHRGEAAERRHDAIWPELAVALGQAGVSDYAIWLDEETHHLLAVCRWDHMSDIMEVLPDNAPVQVPPQKMFHPG